MAPHSRPDAARRPESEEPKEESKSEMPGVPRNRGPQNPASEKKSSSLRREKSVQNSALAGGRPPSPGEGKRGEEGYLGYLPRQAQAATRLTLERALAELGIEGNGFAAARPAPIEYSDETA